MRFRKTPSEEFAGFLGEGTAITGELRFSGTVRVDGRFLGSISTEDVLTIGEHAVVDADIKVGAIEVYGRVAGNIDAKRRIDVRSTGHVIGEVHTPTLVIEAGGTFDGRSRMIKDKEEQDGPSAGQRKPYLEGVDEAH